MFGWLVDAVTSSSAAYVLVTAVIVFDAVIPVLPSETLLIAGGVLSARGDLDLLVLMGAGWVGAVSGDMLAYGVGRSAGGRARDRLFRGERARRRLESIAAGLDERPWVVGVARFVPGGRTAATFSAGSLGLAAPRVVVYVVPGGLAWSVVTCLLGYAGGTLFQGSVWASLAVSLGVAALLAGLAEVLHRRMNAPGRARPRTDEPGLHRAPGEVEAE